MTVADELNRRFSVAGARFIDGNNGLPMVKIANDHAFALVSIYGGQILTFRPVRGKEVLWRSQNSLYEIGKPIRGGIPVCWPWFGPHPAEASQPPHGFARIQTWQVDSVTQDDQGRTCLTLFLEDGDPTRRLWPHAFRLELSVRVGSDLQVTLTVRNPGQQPLRCATALHTYFAISDIRRISIAGLKDRVCIDKMLRNERRPDPRKVVVFNEETDRIYIDSPDTCTILDPDWGRRIIVAKEGSRSTVVWNPWIMKASRMSDFGADEWPHMVCVETANVFDDEVCIAPAAAHTLTARISCEAGC